MFKRITSPVAGWLHKTTLLEVRQWWRGEMRRRKREQTAAELGTTMKNEESLLKSMSGLLDDGLMHLRDADRQLLLLRYIEERSHRAIGQTLGTGEDAVRKRIDKALEALTDFFRRRGFSVPAATTTAAALSASAQSAPAGLSAIVAKAALASTGAASVKGIGALFGYFMGLTKTQSAAICLVAVAIPLTYQWKVNTPLANEQKALEAHLALSDLQIHNGAIADIGATAREAVGVIAVGFQVVAPGFAPKAGRDLFACEVDRRDGAALPGHPSDLARGIGPSLCDGHVGSESVSSVHSG